MVITLNNFSCLLNNVIRCLHAFASVVYNKSFIQYLCNKHNNALHLIEINGIINVCARFINTCTVLFITLYATTLLGVYNVHPHVLRSQLFL